jgi:hypothetical protein
LIYQRARAALGIGQEVFGIAVEGLGNQFAVCQRVMGLRHIGTIGFQYDIAISTKFVPDIFGGHAINGLRGALSLIIISEAR